MENYGRSSSTRRAKRYLSEVQHILERVLDDETVPGLLQAESNFTVQGLGVRVSKLQKHNSELQDQLLQLKREAESAFQIPALKLQVAELQASKLNLEREIETCKNESARQMANEDFKYATLSRELACCKDNLDSKQVLLNKYKEGFSDLDQELRQAKGEIVRLQNEVTLHKGNTARAEHYKESTEGGILEQAKRHEQAIAQLQREHAQMLKEAEDRFQLEVKGLRLRAEAAERTAADSNQQISSLEEERQSIREARELVLKAKQLQEALAEERRSSEKQNRIIEELNIKQAGSAHKDTQLHRAIEERDSNAKRLIAAESKIESWNQIALKFMGVHGEGDSAVPSPTRFADQLSTEVQRRRKCDHELLEARNKLICLEESTSSAEAARDDALRHRQASDLHNARVAAEVQSLRRKYIRLKTAIKAGTATQLLMAEEDISGPPQSTGQNDCTQQSQLHERLVESLNAEVTRLRSAAEAGGAYQTANAKLQLLNDHLQQSKDSASTHNKKLASKVSKLQATVSDLTAQNRLLAPSVEEREQLEDDRRRVSVELEEALKKNRLLREYFKSEAAETQRVLGELFGWNVRSTAESESMVVTFSSRFAPRGDDAEIRFTVGRQPLDLKQKASVAVPDRQVDMQLLGRYAAKWETDKRWRTLLAESQSYPSFLAFTCIEELELDASRRRTTTPGTKV